MRSLKRIMADFNKKYDAVKEENKNRYGAEKLPTPDWKQETVPPIIKAIEKATGTKLKNEELRQFGLRAHIPLTFIKDGKEFIYLDVSNSLESGAFFISDFTAPSKKEYKDGTIGQINGMNLQQIRFEPNQKPEDIAAYVAVNIDKFKVETD